MAETEAGQPLEEMPNFRFVMSARTHFVMDDEVLATKDESNPFAMIPFDATTLKPELARSLVDDAINTTVAQQSNTRQSEIMVKGVATAGIGYGAIAFGFLGYESSASWEKAALSVGGTVLALMSYAGYRITREAMQSKSPRLLYFANKIKSLQLARRQLSEQTASTPE